MIMFRTASIVSGKRIKALLVTVNKDFLVVAERWSEVDYLSVAHASLEF